MHEHDTQAELARMAVMYPGICQAFGRLLEELIASHESKHPLVRLAQCRDEHAQSVAHRTDKSILRILEYHPDWMKGKVDCILRERDCRNVSGTLGEIRALGDLVTALANAFDKALLRFHRSWSSPICVAKQETRNEGEAAGTRRFHFPCSPPNRVVYCCRRSAEGNGGRRHEQSEIPPRLGRTACPRGDRPL